MSTNNIQFHDKIRKKIARKKISLNTRICFLELWEESRRDSKPSSNWLW